MDIVAQLTSLQYSSVAAVSNFSSDSVVRTLCDSSEAKLEIFQLCAVVHCHRLKPITMTSVIVRICSLYCRKIWKSPSLRRRFLYFTLLLEGTVALKVFTTWMTGRDSRNQRSFYATDAREGVVLMAHSLVYRVLER